jgi:hypothetical protein
MDLIGRLDTLVLDYQRREVQMLAHPKHSDLMIQ